VRSDTFAPASPTCCTRPITTRSAPIWKTTSEGESLSLLATTARQFVRGSNSRWQAIRRGARARCAHPVPPPEALSERLQCAGRGYGSEAPAPSRTLRRRPSTWPARGSSGSSQVAPPRSCRGPSKAQVMDNDQAMRTIAPMLVLEGRFALTATSTRSRSSGDGYRAVVKASPQGVAITSRNGYDMNDRYRELRGLRDAVSTPVVLDGEIVALTTAECRTSRPSGSGVGDRLVTPLASASWPSMSSNSATTR
jgi:hypothetical protein